jgi:hypothetical protein
MDKPVGLSCPLCLQADEPESMLTIHIDHGLAVREFDISLCSVCVAAIVARIESVVAEAVAAIVAPIESVVAEAGGIATEEGAAAVVDEAAPESELREGGAK